MKTEWELLLASLPEDLRLMIEEGTESIELPAKDHPVFEILRQSFATWFESLEETPTVDETEGADAAPEKVSDKKADAEIDPVMIDLVSQLNVMVGKTAAIAAKNAEDCNAATNRLGEMVSSIDLKGVKNIPQTLETVLAPLKSLQWRIPWMVTGIASLAIASILSIILLNSYSKSIDKNHLAEWRQIKGITEQNVESLRQLGELKVGLTIIPDPGNQQYYLNLQNLDEITGQTDIPNGKAIIFRAKR